MNLINRYLRIILISILIISCVQPSEAPKKVLPHSRIAIVRSIENFTCYRMDNYANSLRCKKSKTTTNSTLDE